MSSPKSKSILSTDVSTSSSIIYAVLAAIVVIGLQPVLSISSPLLSRYPRLHLQRRVQHLVTNLILTWLCTSCSAFSRSALLLVLSAVVVLLLCLHLLRRFPSINGLFVRACGSLLRPHELHGLPAGYYNLLSCLVCVAMNELAPTVVTLPIVRLCLLYEAVGDPMAAVVGTVLLPIPATSGKTAAGSAGMLLTCSAVTALYLLTTHSPLYWSWLVIPPVVCALVERYSGRGSGRLGFLDDNFTVPVVTSFAVSVLQTMHVLPTL